MCGGGTGDWGGCGYEGNKHKHSEVEKPANVSALQDFKEESGEVRSTVWKAPSYLLSQSGKGIRGKPVGRCYIQ